MRKRLSRAILATALAAALAAALLTPAAAPAGPGPAAEGRVWIGTAVGLLYGTPDSDDLLLGFACFEEGDGPVLAVALAHEPVFLADGEAATLELRSAGGALALAGEGMRLLLDDLFLIEARLVEPEARREAGAALAALLTAGGTLSVLVEDGEVELPLDGLAAALEEAPGPAAVFAGCG